MLGFTISKEAFIFTLTGFLFSREYWDDPNLDWSNRKIAFSHCWESHPWIDGILKWGHYHDSGGFVIATPKKMPNGVFTMVVRWNLPHLHPTGPKFWPGNSPCFGTFDLWISMGHGFHSYVTRGYVWSSFLFFTNSDVILPEFGKNPFSAQGSIGSERETIWRYFQGANFTEEETGRQAQARLGVWDELPKWYCQHYSTWINEDGRLFTKWSWIRTSKHWAIETGSLSNT